MRCIIAAAICVLTGAPAFAQAGTSSAPCSASEYRQLDFWVGEWDVFNTVDNVRYAGSRIEAIVGGCSVSETYDSPLAPGGAYMGKSYSAFDMKDGKWRQFYVDTNGAATWYSGALLGEEMTLEAQGPKALLRMVIARNRTAPSVRSGRSRWMAERPGSRATTTPIAAKLSKRRISFSRRAIIC